MLLCVKGTLSDHSIIFSCDKSCCVYMLYNCVQLQTKYSVFPDAKHENVLVRIFSNTYE